jgi:hypothetical protein
MPTWSAKFKFHRALEAAKDAQPACERIRGVSTPKHSIEKAVWVTAPVIEDVGANVA